MRVRRAAGSDEAAGGLRKINGVPTRLAFELMFNYDRSMDTNVELKKIMAKHDLSQKQIIALSQRSRTMVYQWTREPGSRHYAAMHPADLRLVKLELKLGRPKGKPKCRTS